MQVYFSPHERIRTRVLKLGHSNRSLTPATIRPAVLQYKLRGLVCLEIPHVQCVKRNLALTK